MQKYCAKLFVVLASVFTYGCAGMSSETTTDSALVGAGSGALIGAGAGAAIGATIKNGVVGRSAFAGGLIGIPVGAAVGVVAQSVIERSTINSNQQVIEANFADLQRQQADADAYREKLQMESSEIDVDESRKAYRYEGGSLGDYYQ